MWQLATQKYQPPRCGLIRQHPSCGRKLPSQLQGANKRSSAHRKIPQATSYGILCITVLKRRQVSLRKVSLRKVLAPASDRPRGRVAILKSHCTKVPLTAYFGPLYIRSVVGFVRVGLGRRASCSCRSDAAGRQERQEAPKLRSITCSKLSFMDRTTRHPSPSTLQTVSPAALVMRPTDRSSGRKLLSLPPSYCWRGEPWLSLSHHWSARFAGKSSSRSGSSPCLARLTKAGLSSPAFVFLGQHSRDMK